MQQAAKKVGPTSLQQCADKYIPPAFNWLRQRTDVYTENYRMESLLLIAN